MFENPLCKFQICFNIQKLSFSEKNETKRGNIKKKKNFQVSGRFNQKVRKQ